MLKKINDSCYTKLNHAISFTFKHGGIGVLGGGKCWRLNMLTQGVETTIACFVIVDDGHRCYEKYSCDCKLWNTHDALAAANRMIEELLTET